MSLVAVRPNAETDSERRREVSGLVEEEEEEKRSAMAITSLAEVISASRSEKAEPITNSFVLRSSRSRRSRPAMPIAFFGGTGEGEGERGAGIGGAD